MNKGHLRGFQPTKCPLRHILQYTIVTIVSTFAVMGTAGRITQRMVRSNKKKGENKTQG